MSSVLPIPPKIYHPRTLVVVSALLDDQIPASPGVPTTWTAIPRSVEWRKNTARKADTCSIELDYRDFPLDPRMLKDLLVSVHCEDALAPALPMVPTPLNKRFVGIVDVPETVMGPTEEVVKLEARDYTGVWLDTKLSSTPPISLLQPLSVIVEQLRLRVTPLILPAVFTDPAAAAFVPGITKGKTILAIEKDESAWDVLSKLCQTYGLLPVFESDILTIRTATRTSLNVRTMIYGQNVNRLTFKRNLTREPKSRQIVVNAWNPVLGVPVVGIYTPPNVRTKLAANPTGAAVPTVQITQVSYNVVGNYTPAELILIAKRIWDEQATQEVQGELETKEMVDSTLPLGLPMLGLANGDLIVIRLGSQLASPIEGMSPAEAIVFLSDPRRANAINPVAATALVQAWTTSGQLAVTFYVREAVHMWDREQGYTLRATFINFVIGQGF